MQEFVSIAANAGLKFGCGSSEKESWKSSPCTGVSSDFQFLWKKIKKIVINYDFLGFLEIFRVILDFLSDQELLSELLSDFEFLHSYKFFFSSSKSITEMALLLKVLHSQNAVKSWIQIMNQKIRRLTDSCIFSNYSKLFYVILSFFQRFWAFLSNSKLFCVILSFSK